MQNMNLKSPAIRLFTTLVLQYHLGICLEEVQRDKNWSTSMKYEGIDRHVAASPTACMGNSPDNHKKIRGKLKDKGGDKQ